MLWCTEMRPEAGASMARLCQVPSATAMQLEAMDTGLQHLMLPFDPPASAIQVRLRSSSSTPCPTTSFTIARHVDTMGGWLFSADSASCGAAMSE